MELTVGPLARDRPDVADEYEVFFAGYPNLTVLAFNRRTARRAAELRAAHRLLPADAIQVATAIEWGAGAFLTNDRRFRRATAIDVLLLEDFVGR
jgi:predicted nucleic acid-binding protein